MLEIEKVQKPLDKASSAPAKNQPLSAELISARWMIEELRVSLFAQNLKTAYPISVKRIINYLKEI